MTFKFTCPHCGQTIEAETSMIGQTAECPSCRQAIVIRHDQKRPEPSPRQQLPAEKFNEKKAAAQNTPAREGLKVEFPPFWKFALAGILAVNVLLLLVAAWPKTWEYKAIKVRGDITKYDSTIEKFMSVKLEEDELTRKINLFYSKWELVGTVTETETVHPNFGKEDYVTGIQPNTRSHGTILIFRRQKFF